MATATLSFMDSVLLPFPKAGEVQIRMIDKITIPSGPPYIFGDYSVKFLFDPQLHLCSPTRAYALFSSYLGHYFDLEPALGSPIAQQMASSALECVGGGQLLCSHGLSMSVVVEIDYPVNFSDFMTESDDDEEDEDSRISRGMSESDISGLEKETFDCDGEEGSGEICCVCLDEFSRGEVVTRLSTCSHMFHNSCIANWLRKNATCPICRGRCTVH